MLTGETTDMSKRMPAATALGAFLIATSLSSTAAEWPTKPIRLVVPTAAGGAGDLMARTFAAALAPALGQQFVIDNRPGAGGAIATEAIVRVEPDGYTLMLSGLPYHVIGPAMNPNAGFDPIRDFTHIAFFGGSPMVLVAHPSLGVQRFAQLSALSAEGTSGIDYVSAGFGSVGNMVAEYLASRAKLNLRHVPYKGGSAAVVDLVAGHIKVGSLTWSTALPHVRAGILRPLAISTAQRLPDFPDLPTFAELGFDDIVVTAWFSLSGPAGIPGGIVDRLNRLVNGAMTSAEVRQTLERDASLTKPMTPAEFTAFVRSEVDKWTPVVRTFAKPR
jgi:tripartite-type tricarboxylate transporter receptor subunit TctC